MPTHDCGSEVVTKMTPPREIFPKFFQAGYAELVSFIYEDWQDPDHVVIVFGNSLTPDCDLTGRCTDASPCNDECGGHPKTLYMTIYQYGQIEDYDDPHWGEIDYGNVCVTQVTLKLLDFLYRDPEQVPPIPPAQACLYIGYITGTTWCPVIVKVSRGGVEFSQSIFYDEPGRGCTPAGSGWGLPSWDGAPFWQWRRIFRPLIDGIRQSSYRFNPAPTCNPYYAEVPLHSTGTPGTAGAVPTDFCNHDPKAEYFQRIVITE